MIQKVNSPAHLFLVGSAKSAENDPGGSSGSGLAYEPPSQQSSHSDPGSQQDSPEHSKTSELDKGGMTGVVIDLLEIKDHSPSSPSPGLATKYLVDQSKTKGLLLNKKAE